MSHYLVKAKLTQFSRGNSLLNECSWQFGGSNEKRIEFRQALDLSVVFDSSVTAYAGNNRHRTGSRCGSSSRHETSAYEQ
jgi:hypothetical protein